MSNWLVAVDESNYARWAFNLATSMANPKVDVLFLVAVADDIQSPVFAIDSASYAFVKDHNEALERRCKSILKFYWDKAQKLGFNTHLLMGWSTHVGESLCKAIEEKNINNVVLGRRAMGTVKRFFVGSTTRYVLEHANCNVIVAKTPHGPPEEHESIREKVVELEEIERQRRIKEDKKLVNNEDENRKKTLDEVKHLEEKEKERRLKEDEKVLTQEEAERKKNLEQVKKMEEEEKERRLREDLVQHNDKTIKIQVYKWQ
eukprot:TRINITY_DN3695_c0_g1_i1.p1 TRINITY_DN3695_c0_g1~~TRINITY_DN3695_c0_g1_i1.p1  ORF type:complete len:276 (-),score=75.34 TRINITY_DN3695_c0_g1_i1:35-814(-)